MEQFLGKKYALEWQDNFEEYLEFIGKNYIQRKTNLALNQDVCLTKNDDGTYTYHFSTPFASSKTTFTPGVEFVETRADGVKVRALITIEGNKMIHEQMEENGRFSEHVRSFHHDSMTAITAFTTVYYGADKTATQHYVLEVKNVAKAVVSSALRAPTGGIGIGSISSAVPTNLDGFWSSLGVASSSGHVAAGDTTDESESDNERQAEASHSESTAQVTTRARYTYELDRFHKNALVMFVQNRSDVSTGSRVENSTTQDMNAILDTFTGFRFEITTHIDLTCGEIDNKCQEFFQQDFQEYGAIAVVVLTFEGTTGQLSAMDGRFSESIIMRHLTNDLNPTLLAKPRIYITETNRTVSPVIGVGYSVPLDEHPDVLCLHFPTIDYGIMSDRPFLILCKYIYEMADSRDFVAILEKSVADIQLKIVVSLRIEDKPVELNHNFTKDMMLARSVG